jgi:hypothetical protein
MLVAEEAVEIQVLSRQGKSILAIARMPEVSRNTVRRYVSGNRPSQGGGAIYVNRGTVTINDFYFGPFTLTGDSSSHGRDLCQHWRNPRGRTGRFYFYTQ